MKISPKTFHILEPLKFQSVENLLPRVYLLTKDTLWQKTETSTFVCNKCKIEAELAKFLVKTIIDDYAMDFVIDTIRSIKIEEGASAWDALEKEYYLDK